MLSRKNWLFSDSVKGAESSAIVYPLVKTAKTNGMELYEYLQLALSRLPYYGKTPSHEILELLMPRNPDVKRRKYLETPDCI